MRPELKSAVIVDKKFLTDKIVLFKLKTTPIQKSLKPGQFITMYFEPDEALLPRPYSMCNVDNDHITVMFEIKGKGTKKHSKLNIGDKVRILVSLGRDFPYIPNAKILFVGGGMGVAPLLCYINYYKLDDTHCLVYGARNHNLFIYPMDKSTYKVHIKEIVGPPLNYVRNVIHNYDVVMTCGPSLLMDKVVEISKECDKEVYVSVEAHMGCGIGACYCCIAEVNGEYQRVCADGPVFKIR